MEQVCAAEIKNSFKLRSSSPLAFTVRSASENGHQLGIKLSAKAAFKLLIRN